MEVLHGRWNTQHKISPLVWAGYCLTFNTQKMLQALIHSKLGIITLGVIQNVAKSHWAFKLLVAVLTFFEPIKNMYHLMLLVIVINLITGWYKNRKINKDKFSTKKARITAEKIGLFTLYLMVTYMFEVFILKSNENYASRVIAGILILSELKSISENGDEILGGKMFSLLYRKINGLFKK